MSDSNFPKVSIILPTYNGAKHLHQSIESCLNQTYKNIELIIVDDGSIDNTPEIVKSYKDERIKYIRHIKNKGLACALNTGFENSTGEYLTWTSDDNYFSYDAIEYMVNVLNANEKIDFVYAKSYIIDEEGNKLEPFSSHSPRNLYMRNIIGGCFLYRRKVYHEIGKFNSNFPLAEDYEYWLRVYKKFRMVGLDRYLYYYRRHKNALTNYVERNPGQMLKIELRILKNIFSDRSLRVNWFLKRKAYSYRYFCASWAFLNSNNKSKAIKYILKSFVTNPVYFLSKKDFIGLFTRIVMGKSIFNLLDNLNRKIT